MAYLNEKAEAPLRLLPLLGTDSSGPLGSGLFSRDVLAAMIRQGQSQIGKALNVRRVNLENGLCGYVVEVQLKGWRWWTVVEYFSILTAVRCRSIRTHRV